MGFETYSDEEIRRWLWLRAIEWGAFPAYLSQPIAPVLFIFYPWYFVVLGIFLLGVAWCIVRYSFVSALLAGLVVVPVVWLKWPAAMGSSIYLFCHHQIGAGVLALVWPLVASFTGIPAKIGTIELALAKKIGYVSSDAEL
jgi:hypothetical protein